MTGREAAQRARPGRGRCLGRVALVAAFLVGLGGLLLARLVFVMTAPPLPPARAAAPRLVDVPPGSSLRAIAHLLARERLVRDPRGFMALARLYGAGQSLKAGQYEFAPNQAPEAILRTLITGKVKLWPLTVPEGLTYWETAAIVERQGIGPAADFERLCLDRDTLAGLRVPGPTCEGYLYPDTYLVPKTMDVAAFFALMIRRFFQVLPADYEARAGEQGLTLHQAVTLASLIEAEAQRDEERRLISAVYHNRLRKGMLLQCDPTVIYALGKAFDGNIRRRDLALDHPYNTYRYRGLPPGPIGNPGMASLEAAVTPLDVDYLYFVARRDGTHQFSRTLREHNRAVRRYQLGRRGT